MNIGTALEKVNNKNIVKIILYQLLSKSNGWKMFYLIKSYLNLVNLFFNYLIIFDKEWIISFAKWGFTTYIRNGNIS